MGSPSPSSRRGGVLIRPPLNPKPPTPALQNGVVVVGFIGRPHSDVSHLINRVLDANVFGSGSSDKCLAPDMEEEDGLLRRWFPRRGRRISYFHEQERGIVYLQFCASETELLECRGSADVEEDEFGDLQGMLFMFSVCHVIIFIQEGSRLDTQILKKFRILQAAKHAAAPLMKSQTSPLSNSRSSSSSSSRNSVSGQFPSNRSPGRTGAFMRRNGSASSFMSSLGPYTSLFPGQCTPAILFVFVDDFSDFASGSIREDTIDAPSLKEPSSSSLARPNTPAKGSGPVVMLARPVSKSEGELRKKLQSSLDSQIRFSIKKCRTLSGSEPGHASVRGASLSNSGSLFSLDASKVVALLDRSSNQRGESLDFASSLVEDVLNGKATSDSLLLESHSQSSTKEDILSVKDYIYKQADTLRGRGGMTTNTNSGSVGMVAVAAAAAAAASSAASGKALTAPELPSLDIWLSSSQKILQGILAAKPGSLVERGIVPGKTHQTFAIKPPPSEGMAQRVADPLDTALSCLEGCKGLNDKFSTLWCQRALPAAKEVYLNDLPACYPTSKHKLHLEKALLAFRSTVKGSAVEFFVKKLEDECTVFWSSGRQLCDSISLTGKPCMHQRHGVGTDGGISEDGTTNPHSSGFVFLQACACGRSRRLQPDPFDFETANITSKCFDKCCQLLPLIELPRAKNVGPIQESSWSLIRVGEGKYYEPSKGLLQSGFSPTQKFLSKWTIFLEKPKTQNDVIPRVMHQDSASSLSTALVDEPAGNDEKKPDPSRILVEEPTDEKQILAKPQAENNLSDGKKINFDRGIPNFTLRKPFSEVVAGSAAGASKFPPLQSRKQISGGSEKGDKQSSKSDSNSEKVCQNPESTDQQGTKKSVSSHAIQKSIKKNGIDVDLDKDHSSFPEIGSNLVRMKLRGGSEKSKSNMKHVNVYVGFEYECPCGHRFILTPEHLNELGSPYPLSEGAHIPSNGDYLSNERQASSKFVNDVRHGKPRHTSYGNSNIIAGRKVRNINKTKDIAVKGNSYSNRVMQLSSAGQEHDPSLVGGSEVGNPVNDLKEGLHSLHFTDDASALLNKNLPIYMNCPHCRISKNRKDPSTDNFAGAISQLQRIFMVTPSLPIILAACPVIQFEASCLSSSVPDREQKLKFSFERPIILPPESFLSLKLPFIYGVQLEDGLMQSLRPFDHQPEHTAWISNGTSLQIMSKESSV